MTLEEIMRDEPWQVPLWDAVNEYRSGNIIQREKAVVKVNEIVRQAIAAALTKEARRLDWMLSEGGDRRDFAQLRIEIDRCIEEDGACGFGQLEGER